MAAHGISSALPTHPPTVRLPAMPLSSKYMMAQSEGHFNNPASAATNSGAALDQIAATTTTQYSEINSLLTSLKDAIVNSSHSAAAATSATPPNQPGTSQEAHPATRGRRVQQLAPQ